MVYQVDPAIFLGTLVSERLFIKYQSDH